VEHDTRARVGSATLADPLTGRILDGRYRIGRKIARGGMASVYEAVDVRLDRVCAVKVMHPGLGDDAEFAERLRREARAAAGLSHPNVVNVYDQGDDPGVDGGTLYLVMELVPGRTMRDVVRDDAPLPPARAVALMEPVVAALAAAHRSGLVHRDIKPENVLIAPDGAVKVADFGLAKAVSAETQHTATGGVIIGTVSYLAPELVVDGTCDARADVYAAGVMLYELLTGRKPHEGESPIAIAYKHVHEDVPPPSGLALGVPRYVDALVARATARDRMQRPADAGVLLHQLHRVAQALAGGVWDDQELTTDLALSPRHVADETSALDILPLAPAAAAPVLEPSNGAEDTNAVAPLMAPPAARPTVPAVIAGGDGSPARRRRRWRPRRGPAVLAIALALALAAGVGAYWFGWARYTATPSVLGLSQSVASHRLETAGLHVAVGSPAFSETVPKGEVVTTDPSPGSRVLDHGTVTLVVSKGKERYAVPQVGGMTENQAQDALLATHLGFGRAVPRWSDTVPKGRVITTNPVEGMRLARSTEVDLIMSRGPRPIHVADWQGRNAAFAAKVMRSHGLSVDTSQQEYSDTVPRGHVISQDPATGVLHPGDTVKLVVSKGPQLVQVPGNLRAMGVQAATQLLHGLGFRVRVEKAPYYLGIGYVYSSDPGPGQMAPKGSVVTLEII
jgi:eukaryotic-like serine/threonine-protein kinase